MKCDTPFPTTDSRIMGLLVLSNCAGILRAFLCRRDKLRDRRFFLYLCAKTNIESKFKLFLVLHRKTGWEETPFNVALATRDCRDLKSCKIVSCLDRASLRTEIRIRPSTLRRSRSVMVLNTLDLRMITPRNYFQLAYSILNWVIPNWVISLGWKPIFPRFVVYSYMKVFLIYM